MAVRKSTTPSIVLKIKNLITILKNVMKAKWFTSKSNLETNKNGQCILLKN